MKKDLEKKMIGLHRRPLPIGISVNLGSNNIYLINKSKGVGLPLPPISHAEIMCGPQRNIVTINYQNIINSEELQGHTSEIQDFLKGIDIDCQAQDSPSNRPVRHVLTYNPEEYRANING